MKDRIGPGRWNRRRRQTVRRPSSSGTPTKTKNMAQNENPQKAPISPAMPGVASGGVFCWIGLHRWETVGFKGVLYPEFIDQCKRCGIGRQLHWSGAAFRYTRQQLEEAMKQNDLGVPPLGRSGTQKPE